jgi:hypothetical protein
MGFSGLFTRTAGAAPGGGEEQAAGLGGTLERVFGGKACCARPSHRPRGVGPTREKVVGYRPRGPHRPLKAFVRLVQDSGIPCVAGAQGDLRSGPRHGRETIGIYTNRRSQRGCLANPRFRPELLCVHSIANSQCGARNLNAVARIQSGRLGFPATGTADSCGVSMRDPNPAIQHTVVSIGAEASARARGAAQRCAELAWDSDRVLNPGRGGADSARSFRVCTGSFGRRNSGGRYNICPAPGGTAASRDPPPGR